MCYTTAQSELWPIGFCKGVPSSRSKCKSNVQKTAIWYMSLSINEKAHFLTAAPDYQVQVIQMFLNESF